MIQGAWSWVQTPPAAVAALAPAGGTPVKGEGPTPRVIVRTRPTELLVTSGLPDFRSIRGTALQYAADSDSQLFFQTTDREAYLLLSGRWFKAKSLSGPWTHVAPRELPADFAKIPPGSPQAVVLASVPETRQAELALLANSVPTTATVRRRDAKIELTCDGEPKFKPIEGTRMSYAVNAKLPVVLSGNTCYALDNGVWFTATAATGPWSVATEVPEEIYTIPPGSPVYYATFASVLQSSDDEVEVSYTPGYQGAYEDDGTVVYGTGWDATVQWAPLTYSKFTFTTSKNFGESTGVGDFLLTKRYGATWIHNWNPRLSTTAGISRSNDDFVNGGRSDSTDNIGLKLNYKVQRWLTLGGEFNNTNRDSSNSTFNYKKNVYSFTVGATL